VAPESLVLQLASQFLEGCKAQEAQLTVGELLVNVDHFRIAVVSRS
jgi:hypothetical protein